MSDVQDIITRVRIALANHYLITKSFVSDSDGEELTIIVKLKVRNAFVDNPTDLTSLMRIVRSKVPQPWSVRFQITTSI
jgi:hypothetical protein